MMYIQEIIFSLTELCKQNNFLILTGYPSVKGAATSNPEFIYLMLKLREKMPNVCFVDSCVRAFDAGYIESSMRLMQHHQMEIVCQNGSEDLNSYSILNDSFKLLKLNDTNKFALEYIEDDWKQQNIGASGYGWEVRCNGLEIVQLTFFKTLASQKLFPFPFEIAFGLERLGMILQNKTDIYDVKWNKEYTIRDLFAAKEQDILKSFSLFTHETFNSKVKEHIDNIEQYLDKQIYFSVLNEINSMSYIIDIGLSVGYINNLQVQQYIKMMNKYCSIVGESLKVNDDK